MDTVKLEFDTSINLEEGEEIVFANLPHVVVAFKKGRTFKEDLIAKFTFGLGPVKLSFKCNLVLTNKRVVLIPYPNQKRTKTEMFETHSFYYGKGITGASVMKELEMEGYAEQTTAGISLIPAKGVELYGLWLHIMLDLSLEEALAIGKKYRANEARKKEINDTIGKVDALAGQLEHDSFLDAFGTQAYIELWKSSAKAKQKVSVTGGKDITPMRDFLTFTINKFCADAK